MADLYVPEHIKGKVLILLPGLPKSSNAEKIIKNFLASGCVVLYPNFSGSFDSGGSFSGPQCIEDVKEFIEWGRQEEVTELYFGKKIILGTKNEIILTGMSFGAIAALLGCNNNVNKLLLLSPALLFNQSEINKIVQVDFQNQMDSLLTFMERAFPHTYRVESYVLLKEFLHGNLENQSSEDVKNTLTSITIPTFVLHGKMDTSVPWNISASIKKSVKNKSITWKFIKVGHSTSSYTRNALRLITRFIET